MVEPEHLKHISKDQLRKFGKTSHVFISYSHHDAITVRNEIKRMIEEDLQLITCTYEDDFVPGQSIIDNITTAIRESLKVILVISENFTESSWCKYESDLTLSLSLDMRNKIIPLILDDSELPDSLKIYSGISYKDKDWFDKLEKALDSPIEKKHDNKIPPTLQEGKTFHFISIAHSNTLQNENENHYSKLQILRQMKEDKSKPFEFVDIRLGGVDENNFEFWKNGSKDNEIELMKLLSTILNDSRKAYKILIWLSDDFVKDCICQNVEKMLCMIATDLGKDSPCIIPIQLAEDGEMRGGPEIQRDMFTHLFTVNGKWRDKLITTICTKNHTGRHDERECIFKQGTNIARVARFSGKEESDGKPPRYLGVSFAGNNLILLDADNKVIKKCNIFGKMSDKKITANDMEEYSKAKSLSLMPNRLSKIDEKTIAVLCRNDNKVFVINTLEMLIENCIRTTPEVSLKGLTAFGLKGFYATTGTGRPQIIFIDATKEGVNVEEKLKEVDNEYFGLPRRLTKTPDGTRIVVADEDDRRLVVFNPEENGALTVEYSTNMWQRNLSNVRGIAASDSVVYVAASNCIKSYDFEELNEKQRELDVNDLIKFTSKSLHTRAVSLHSSGNYLAISQSLKDTDIVTVFCLNSDKM